LDRVKEIIKGALDQKPLVEAIGQIYSSRQTGEMQVKVKKSEYNIFFLKGIPVYAQSSLASDNILEFMVHLGQLERDDVPRLKAMIKEGLEPDQAIFQTGVIDATKLYYLKMLLAREIIKSRDAELSKRGTEARDALFRIINTLNNPEDRNQYEKSLYNASARRELDSIEKHQKTGFFEKSFSKKISGGSR
jgi:hypothetical protein